MLSTPDICCSMGVATDCSTVMASAPVYVAWIWTSGGTISGNCATGSETRETMPQITITMAITIETMGRLMKNLDMRRNHRRGNLDPKLKPQSTDAANDWRILRR